MLDQKGNGLIVGVFIGLLIAGGLFGAYYFGKSQTLNFQAQNLVTPSQSPQVTVVGSSTPDETANWETYTNKDLGFSIKYPPKLKINKEPVPFKNIDGTSWFFGIDDRQGNDVSGSTINTSILIQFSEKSISGETGKPITRIEETIHGVEDTTIFKVQDYPAIKGKITSSVGDVSIFINILKNNSVWSLDGNTKSGNETNLAEINQILSTFKFDE